MWLVTSRQADNLQTKGSWSCTLQVPWLLWSMSVITQNAILSSDENNHRPGMIENQYTLTLWHILLKGYSILFYVDYFWTVEIMALGSFQIGKQRQALKFDFPSTSEFLNWKKWNRYDVISKVPIIVCVSFLLTVSLVFWGLNCNYIVNKLFQC